MKALSLIEFVKLDLKDKLEILDFLKIQCYYTEAIVKYADHLNQPFTPELIVEKFKGWEYIADKCMLIRKEPFIGNPYDYIEIKFGIYAVYAPDAVNQYTFFKPRTLSDFINDCQRAGIE